MIGENFDNMGRRIEERYSVILTDPYFEKRLKAFDPRLKLLFDQGKKRWSVLEWAYDNSGWNIIFTAEDDEGNPKPLGEWVFNRLFVMRERHESKKHMGIDAWINELKYKADCQQVAIEEKGADDRQARLREDVLQWRKAVCVMDNEPASDVTAGYPKKGSYESRSRVSEHEGQDVQRQPGVVQDSV